MQQFQGLIGIVVMLGIALALSKHRRHIPWRIVAGGLALQFLLGWLLLAFPPLVGAVNAAATAVTKVISAADAGSAFVFGSLAGDTAAGGGPAPWGFVFAFRVLTIIVFFAALMAILYHWGIMQLIIAGLAWILRGTLGVTGTEALAMAANVFVGQTEAPLCVRPYIGRMTRSQLMALMVGGFATIAGSVLAAYVLILGGAGEDEAVKAARVLFAKHLLTASLMSAPAAFVIAKIIVPETEEPVDEGLRWGRSGGSADAEGRPTTNALDAAAAGTTDGLRLALNVGAMLIAFVSLIALANIILDAAGDLFVSKEAAAAADKSLTLQMLLGWLFTPLAWTMGVPWEDCGAFGALLGEKLIATEFYAYGHLGQMMQADEPQISARAGQIAAYALCGFANLPSIGIQIGGLTALAPERRSDFAALAMKAMIGGALASWMTACVAGVFIQA